MPKAEKAPKEKKEKKEKKAKDPNAPKKAATAYLLFCNENRAKVKEEMPNATGADIMKKLGQMWQDADEDDKKKFQDLASKDKERADTEMKAYKGK